MSAQFMWWRFAVSQVSDGSHVVPLPAEHVASGTMILLGSFLILFVRPKLKESATPESGAGRRVTRSYVSPQLLATTPEIVTSLPRRTRPSKEDRDAMASLDIGKSLAEP